MQKTFKNQQGREFVFITSVYEPHTLEFKDSILRQCGIDGVPRVDYFPSDNYKIFCTNKDSTELFCQYVVDCLFDRHYFDYMHKNSNGYGGDYNLSYAKQSLTSLLTSLGFKQDDNVLILEKI